MILAFDTSSASCTAALFDEDGRCLARRDEVIGRGHAERLVPMIAEMLDGRAASRILVGVGPGSFTGIRVAIAAAHGLAIGWGAELAGMNSLALLAAETNPTGNVAAAILGGHGELFVQSFDGRSLRPTGPLMNDRPDHLGGIVSDQLVVGSGARLLVEARGHGDARDLLPSAANALNLPEDQRTLPPKPLYARAPDARVPEAA